MVDVTLTSYLLRCLKKSQPGLRLSKELAERLNKRVNRLARAMVRGAAKSALAAKRKTLLHKDIETALFKVLADEELCGKLVHHAAKAISALEKSDAAGKVARSKRAGILFSVPRMAHIIRNGVVDDKLRVSEGSAVCLAAILEGLSCELFSAAGGFCSQDRRKVVTLKDYEKALEASKALQTVL
ncbi:hypothetical protein Ndes2526B_g04487 [Nannochloris sp. 'desiccata']|jgi:histone H3/H4|nr:hypothetical protein NADE_003184 [Chlorella desiccata (nom. nud.)]